MRSVAYRLTVSVFCCIISTSLLGQHSVPGVANSSPQPPMNVRPVAETRSDEVRRTKCNYDSFSNEGSTTVEGKNFRFTKRDYERYREVLGFSDDQISSFRNKRVLDVAAGEANFVDVLNEHFGVDAVAIDIAYENYPLENYSKECQRLFHERRFTMNAMAMHFPNNYFDLVVSQYFLMYFFSDGYAKSNDEIDTGFKMVEEMIRVTANGGELWLKGFRGGSSRTEYIEQQRKSFENGQISEGELQRRIEFANEYVKKLEAFLEKYKDIIKIEFQGHGVAKIKKIRRQPNEVLRDRVEVKQDKP